MNVGARSDLDARADFCRELALSAGRVAMAGFERQVPGSHRMKGPQDFLTETDAAVERHVRAALGEAFPGDGFLGEETGGSIGVETWVVDPRGLSPGPARLSIRPHSLAIVGDTANTLPGVVTKTTYAGSHTEIELETVAGQLFLMSADTASPPAPGTHVHLGLPTTGSVLLLA